VVNLARVVLALGSAGRAVLIGRGAHFILPRQTTLAVRLVAPLEERIAYMRQWLRLTEEEAAERVRVRDSRRTEFLATHFHKDPADVYQYDLVLNSSRLGEDACAELIAQAARARGA
jgi:cytidylate kinase